MPQAGTNSRTLTRISVNSWMTGSEHLFRNVRRHPLLRRHPTPLQGPSQRLHEARSATKGKGGVPVPGADG